MQSLELFSGAGGLAKGLELAGFKHMAFVECNKDACATLRRNFDSTKVFEGNVKYFSFESLDSVDLVAGGPPCQPFSLGGKHRGYFDTRDMFPYAIQAISILKPKAFVFENVKGLLRQSFSDYFEYILLRLQYPSMKFKYDCWKTNFLQLRATQKSKMRVPDYVVQYRLINAADYGTPQVRERVIIVGIRSDLGTSWEFPEGAYSEERLLWDQYVTMEYWDRNGISKVPSYPIGPTFQNKINNIKLKYGLWGPDKLPWRTIREALAETPDPGLSQEIPDHIFRAGARSYPGHTGSTFDLPAKTIKAGGHGVPGGENMIRFPDDSIRYLTVYEAKLLQGFPSDFYIHGTWGEAMRQIGNAVPVNLAQIIGNQLMHSVMRSKATA